MGGLQSLDARGAPEDDRADQTKLWNPYPVASKKIGIKHFD